MGKNVGPGRGTAWAATRALQDGSYLNRDSDTQDLLRRLEWEAVDERKREAEGPLFEDVQAMFRAQADRIERSFEQGTFRLPEDEEAVREDTPNAEQQATILTAEKVLALSTAVSEMQELTEEHAERLLQAGWEVAQERLDADTPFNPDDPAVTEAADDLISDKAPDIAKATRGRITQTIAKGVADGKSIEEIQGAIVSEVRGMAKTDDAQSRARRIASTTTTTLFEQGQQRSMDKAGVYGGMWLSQRDTNVRTGHLVADGQTQTIGDPFEVACQVGEATEELEFPGDPTGSACNIINCRCTVLPIPDQETFSEMEDEEPDLSNLPQLSEEQDG